MSVPSGPMATRFNRVRLEHIYRTLRKGPTEAGYAYFRARRRRRNVADDEPVLSESDQLALSGAFDIDEQAIADNAQIIRRYLEGGPMEIRTVLWLLPFFDHAYFGGIYTLLRFADHFARIYGVENRFHVYDAGSIAGRRVAHKVSAAFPALADSTFTSAAELSPADLPPVDAAIATLWTSAFPLLHLRRVKAKFYFVQDNEPQFYAAGAASGMVEETYRFGFPGIVNTPGLAEVYRSYGNPAMSFVPAVDLDRYHPAPLPHDPAAPVRIFFYARPSTPRNAFGLGLAALAQLKERCADRVHIICAGENWRPGQFGMAGQIENLGILGSLDEVAALYRTCDIGLVFMHTKHPSYQPLEFMASGMATVSNINPATQWLLRDGENCLLAPPLPTPTADRLVQLLEEPELRRRIADAGLEEIRRYRWDDQIDAVWRGMCRSDQSGAGGFS